MGISNLEMDDMFMVHSSETAAMPHIVEVAFENASNAPVWKPKPKAFEDLAGLLSKWEPIDAAASRKVLSSEIMTYLEEKGCDCIKACIPSIIVERQFPIDLIHCASERDFDEFLTRMLWMQQVYGMALGIMIGASHDEQAMARIEEACENLLTEKDCLVFLI